VNDTLSIAAIICAAGSSSRMGGIKKEYQKIDNNITVLGSSVLALMAVPSVKVIIAVIPENDEAAARESLPENCRNEFGHRIVFVSGGNTRQISVYNALKFLAVKNLCFSKPDYVLIHDGARPWVTVTLIEKLIDAAVLYNAVIPVLPVTETPKEIENGQVRYVKNHLKRVNVCAAQTPQGFKFPEIFHAHEKAAEINEEFTDDAEIWGRFCGKDAVIDGEALNKKITFPEDLK